MEWTTRACKKLYLEPHRNEENALPMAKYMKNTLPFFRD